MGIFLGFTVPVIHPALIWLITVTACLKTAVPANLRLVGWVFLIQKFNVVIVELLWRGFVVSQQRGLGLCTISCPSAQYLFLLFTCSSTTSSLVLFDFYGLLVQLLWFYRKFYIVWVFPCISQQHVAVPLEIFLEECSVDLRAHQPRLCLLLKKSLLLNPNFSSPTLDGGGSGSYFRFLNYSN